MVKVLKVADLVLAREKVQKCCVVPEEKLDDTGACWEKAPRDLCVC